MSGFSSLFEDQEGRPVKIGSQKVTLVSRTLRFQVPGFPAGLFWSRPYAVKVETEGANEVTLPVVDETRMLQVLLLGLGLVGSIFLGMLLARR